MYAMIVRLRILIFKSDMYYNKDFIFILVFAIPVFQIFGLVIQVFCLQDYYMREARPVCRAMRLSYLMISAFQAGYLHYQEGVNKFYC